MKTIIHAMGMHSRKYGGLEVFVLDVVKNFTARGYRSVLIYHSTPTINRCVKDIGEAGGEIVICEYGGFFFTSSSQALLPIGMTPNPEINLFCDSNGTYFYTNIVMPAAQVGAQCTAYVNAHYTK